VVFVNTKCANTKSAVILAIHSRYSTDTLEPGRVFTDVFTQTYSLCIRSMFRFIQAVIPIIDVSAIVPGIVSRRDISHDVSTMYWQCIGSRAGRLLDGLVLGVVSEVVLTCVFHTTSVYRCNTRRSHAIHDEYKSGF
jgi:hypothetical protein